jgi:hypothetical protein
LEFSFVGPLDARFKEGKAAVDIGVLSDFIRVFEGKLIDYSSCIVSKLSIRKNALISCNFVLFHEQYSFGSESVSKNDIVVILQIVS